MYLVPIPVVEFVAQAMCSGWQRIGNSGCNEEKWGRGTEMEGNEMYPWNSGPVFTLGAVGVLRIFLFPEKT